MSKNLIFLISFVLVLGAAGTAWAIPFDKATAIWNLNAADPRADEMGPEFSNLSTYYYADVEAVTGAESAEHWDGWAAPSAAYWWSPMYYGTAGELKPVGAVTFMIRVRLADVSGGDDGLNVLSGLYDGSCVNSAYPSYGIELHNGEPFYVVTEAGQEGTTRTEVGLGQTIEPNTWYDMSGTFDPDNDTITITVAESGGGIIGTASLPVTFDELYYSDNSEWEIFVSPCAELGGAEGNGHIELVAVWIGAVEVFGVQVSNISPRNSEDHVLPDTELCFQAPKNALCMWVDDPNDPNDKPPDPNLLGPFDYDVWFGTDPCALVQIADSFTPVNCNDVMCFDPCAGDLDPGTWYYWRADINDANGGGDPCFYQGSVFSFRTWGVAYNPSPANGQVDVTVDPVLSWTVDGFASTVDVYLGTDEAAVANANTSSPEYQATQAASDANWSPSATLTFNTTYYWRIDESNSVTPKGDVWHFTTSEFRWIDDFDSYDVTTNIIRDTWKDYWTDTSNGGEVWLQQDPNFDLDFDGNSMEFRYDNDWDKAGGKNLGSWAEASITDLPVAGNWDFGGVEAIVLNFRGLSTNTAVAGSDNFQLTLEDTATNTGTVIYPDTNALLEESWHEWNIELADPNFAGLNVSSIAKVTLKTGGPLLGGKGAGTGTLYFDDFMLWPPRCRTELVPTDITDDCITDNLDLQLIASDWLTHDFEVPPEEPSRANLLVEYLFDTDANYNDTSGNGYHGVAFTPGYPANGATGGTLHLDSTGYVDIGGDFNSLELFDGSKDWTVAMSFKPTGGDVTMLSFSRAEPWDPCEPGATEGTAIYSLAGKAPAGTVYYDVWNIGWTWSDEGANPIYDGNFHHFAITYDADGGITTGYYGGTPGEITGLANVFVDGNPTTEDRENNFDPNVPDANRDTIRIGAIVNANLAGEAPGPFVGEIDNVRIYDVVLPHSSILYLADVFVNTYFPNESPANIVPKDPPGAPFDPNNMDIVDLRDLTELGNHWLEGPILWP